jgi:putative flippase GtrA
MIKKTFYWGLGILDKYVALRYLIAGGTAGVTDLLVLYVLNSVFGVYYLLSAIFAYIVAFVVSFTGHKYWTFKSHKESIHRQVVSYLGATLFGLALNTLLMYLFVDYFHILVLLSQIIVGFMVASVSFFISRNVVFKYKDQPKVENL